MTRKYEFSRSLGMLARQISKGLGINLQEHFNKNGIDLDPISWSVISFLKKHPNRTQKEIVNFLWIDKVKVKRVVDKLEADGHVKREIHKTDKRYNLVKLTDKGNKFFETVVPLAENILNNAFEGFSKVEEEQLIDYMIRIKKNL